MAAAWTPRDAPRSVRVCLHFAYPPTPPPDPKFWEGRDSPVPHWILQCPARSRCSINKEMTAAGLQMARHKLWVKQQRQRPLPETSRERHLNLWYPRTWPGVTFGTRDLDFRGDAPAAGKQVPWGHAAVWRFWEEGPPGGHGKAGVRPGARAGAVRGPGQAALGPPVGRAASGRLVTSSSTSVSTPTSARLTLRLSTRVGGLRI